ncbi:pseudouridine synthase [Marinomonas gallaica]|uniref:pseudouridine synthase n=1 Tax=Marinomonas gallaica TaxID=1806667 RepID=UPI003CE4DC3D
MDPIEVVLKHDDFWVVVKPADESFHSEDGMGFAERLNQTYPEQTFYSLHRLDKMTSGLILFATNKTAAAVFGDLFAQHALEKRYIAVSVNKPKKKQGTISGSMLPSRRGQWKLSAQGDNLAVTQFFSFSESGKRYFWIRPLTGKTHQIRVALKSIGAAILGDERYSGEVSDRGYLHAYSLAFEWQGEPMYFESWPKEGEHFPDSIRSLYQQYFFEPSLSWPKFTIPKKTIL